MQQTLTSKFARRSLGNLVALVLSTVTCMGSAMAEEPTSPAAKSLTRQEVIADMAMWQRAGLDRFTEPEIQAIYMDEYQAALRQYQALRSGPAYAQELNRLMSGNGRLMAETQK